MTMFAMFQQQQPGISGLGAPAIAPTPAPAQAPGSASGTPFLRLPLFQTLPASTSSVLPSGGVAVERQQPAEQPVQPTQTPPPESAQSAQPDTAQPEQQQDEQQQPPRDPPLE